MAASDRRTRGLLALSAIGLAVAGLVACNQILGTDKFSDGEETPGDAASPDGTAEDGSGLDGATRLDASLDSSFDGSILLPPGSNPAQWVTFPMPDIVTDAAPAPSYSVGFDGGVVDGVTQLTWENKSIAAGGGTPTFAEANDACKKRTTGGSKWRVPTRIELVTLLQHVDIAGNIDAGPMIDQNFFTISATTLWTASPVLPAETPQRFWLVNFNDGSLTRGTTALQVLCVKDKP